MSEGKKPWEEHPEIWKSQASFMGFIRGGIRKSIWNRYPVKIKFTNNNRKRIKNPNPRGRAATVWGGTCHLCKKDFIQSQLQVDHVKGNHSLKSMDDLQEFVTALTHITEDDLAFVCKPCHYIKSYSEKQGISFEEAAIEKKVIEFAKEKSLTKQLQTLKSLGVVPEKETKKSAKEAYRNYLKKRRDK